MKPVVEKLENGLKVVLRPSRTAPVVAFQMWVKVGSADEHKGEEGIAHVFEHMLFKGTKRRAVGEIARDVERAGGHINAWTSHDETVFFITLASRYWQKGLDILADAIQHPSMDRNELNRELAVIREEIRMGDDAPEHILIEKFFGQLFKKHPYGRPVIGYDRTVKAFTREMVADFYNRWYVPSNMALVVAGDFEIKTMLNKIQGALGSFPAGDIPARTSRVLEPTQRKPRVSHAVKPISETHFAIGFPIPGLTHEDIPALDLLAAVIGQGASSRLETTVRRKLSLVNTIRSMAYTPRDMGLFSVFAIIPPHNLTRAAQAVVDELFRVTKEPISSAEIEKSRNLLESDKVYSEETVDGIARKLGFYVVHAEDIEFEEKYLASLAGIGPEDLLEVARRYIVPSAVNLTAVVPDPTRYTPKHRTPWISGRGSARIVNGAKLEKSLLAQIDKRTKKPRKNLRPLAIEEETVVCELSTGDVLIVRNDPSSKLVAVRAAFWGGMRWERPFQAGISNLLAGSVTRGTEELNAEEIALKMDAMACSVGGFAGRNTLGVHGEFLKRNFAKGFRLMAECLRCPVFPDKEIEREKELVIEEIRASRDNPGYQVFNLFHETLFGKHPNARRLSGNEETVQRLSSKDLKRFLAQTTSTGTMIMAAVGGTDMDEIRELAEQHILAKNVRVRAPKDPKPWLPPDNTRQVTRALPKEQSHIVIGFQGTRLTSPDRFSVEVLTEILGGHGGRLFDGVREKKGLAYAVTASSMEGIEPGYVAMYAATSPGQEAAVVQAMLQEVEKIRKTPPRASELTRVKRHLIGSKAIAWQRAAARAASMALDHLYGNGHDAAEHYAERIDAVTRDSVKEAASSYLDPTRLIAACVGPNTDGLKLI
ncbi:MAG: insulinase family protein [Proteobacteria bacterium]|nr:insulinase family protein [Pseudomonadota bacterium]